MTKSLAVVAAGAAVVQLAVAAGTATAPQPAGAEARRAAAATWLADGDAPWAPGDLRPAPNEDLVQEYCVPCHNERRLLGNMSLEEFDAADPAANAPIAEKMIRKLRAGMMPPPGQARPPEDEVIAFVMGLEEKLDAAAALRPNPGSRSFQRLNRAEYAAAIRDLLGIEIDASAYLPGETMSGGFDNIADVQNLSATLLESYLTAASEVSRLALGDARATPSEATYEVSRYAEQREHVPGAPFGTRGGISVLHNFVADGEYFFRLAFQHESTGNFFGQTAPFDEEIEVSIDGERVALIPLDRWMHRQDPNGVEVVTERIPVTAGPHRVSAAFIKVTEGPVEDLASPHEWSLADKKIGYSYGITGVPHLRDLTIGGPYDITGVTRTPAWERVMTCRPATVAEEPECARRIIYELGTRGFRRPVAEPEIEGLMGLYEQGYAEGGFDIGVRTALQGILASPDFIFRFEEAARGSAGPGGMRPISDVALASRLSFFLWGSAPDEGLIEIAAGGGLSQPDIFEAQVDRMLADPRADALGTRFAAQWLRLQDLDKVHPDALRYPDFYEQLAHDMRHETETFFNALVRDGGTLPDFLTADFSYMNERLARHYGIPGVAGEHFRRVEYTEEARRGILGHGSFLTLTSHANRTSPVLRGKWVMEVLLGTPPPPPPPDIPELEDTDAAADGRFLTVRERLEQHRASPMCISCHRFIDPIGIALENFDVTGTWRVRDTGTPVETLGELYDGTPLEGPGDLIDALLRRPESLARTFATNLMAYALGRRIEYYDMPAVRSVARAAGEHDFRLSAFVKEVARSQPFRMSMAAATVEEPADAAGPVRGAGPTGNRGGR
ncbi:MAG: DUF1592 domain-containing protein [Gemmatimonadota bacterium]|nr:DUF1592 domain-containing protein [Gemmatimonadota bacterium]